ncbi:MAG: SpvB/TcaC N-terminal domain-containing protein, partial [Polyangiaceae bacterium]
MTARRHNRALSLLHPTLRPLAAFVLVALTGMACGSSDPREATTTAEQTLESPPWEEIPDPDPTPTAPFGRIDATAGVDPRGQFTYSIPLWVPEGRAGMAPEVSLSYNSGRGNGALGVGWSLAGESFLHRCGKTVARDGQADNVDFDEDDNFCLDGTKLIEVTFDDPPGFVEPPNEHGVIAEYRLERNNNSRVLAFGEEQGYPSGWVVLTEDGRVHYYEAPVGASRYPSLEYVRLGWMRDRVTDRHGNEIHYTYFNPYFQLPSTKTGIRLEKIEYTISSSGPYAGTPTREVRFIYDAERPDPISSWVSGIEIVKPTRISQIEMWAPPVSGGTLKLAREYKLDYTESQRSHRSLLDAVTLCDGVGACLPP